MEPFLGEIRLFTWDFTPRGWQPCDGRLIAIQQNTALFSLLGTYYGGDGRSTFALPDLRGRAPVSRSSQLPLGTPDGAEAVTITTATMPAHVHQMSGTSTIATVKPPTGNLFANDTAPGADFYAIDTTPLQIAPATIGSTGGGQPHSNMQPYLALNFCMAVQGLFPSRN